MRPPSRVNSTFSSVAWTSSCAPPMAPASSARTSSNRTTWTRSTGYVPLHPNKTLPLTPLQEQISTYTTSIQTDYFGKGNTTSYNRDTTVSVTTPEEIFHTYSIDWTSSRIEWLLDGEVVRTLEYADAVGGKNSPQTPARIKIGIWAGGDPDNGEGTIEWAGGETSYTDVPFTMYVDSINVTNYNPAQSYEYSDQTGDYTSIKASNSTSSTNLKSTSSSVSSSARSSSSSLSSSSVSKSSAGASAASVSASASASASTSANATSGASISLYSSLFVISMATFSVGLFQL